MSSPSVRNVTAEMEKLVATLNLFKSGRASATTPKSPGGKSDDVSSRYTLTQPNRMPLSCPLHALNPQSRCPYTAPMYRNPTGRPERKRCGACRLYLKAVSG